jgi:hypothetical protein
VNDSHVNALLTRYRSEGILIDTNLMLLYLVGLFDRNQIERFKRTSQYSQKDFDGLCVFVNHFSKIVTTPHILTELSNLSGHFEQKIRRQFFEKFSDCILRLDEKYIPSEKICQENHFQNFGLTDAAITELSKNKYLVLTDDLSLSAFLQTLKIDVINFNHFRPLFWDMESTPR